MIRHIGRIYEAIPISKFISLMGLQPQHAVDGNNKKNKGTTTTASSKLPKKNKFRLLNQCSIKCFFGKNKMTGLSRVLNGPINFSIDMENSVIYFDEDTNGDLNEGEEGTYYCKNVESTLGTDGNATNTVRTDFYLYGS